ncbi:hypothetical protein [Planomicrobium okeanokoites]|uniref:hypothetical protein n=1 Tax=Planomicrobium okeanokoites TaxID=244 RepID=UPI0024913382|nr:hypothetical protein [Planomicrobium okeanokoites]
MKTSIGSSGIILSWVILIGGIILFISVAPFALLLATMPFWKPDEVSFLSMLFTAIPVSISILIFWTIKSAYKSIKNQRNQSMDLHEETFGKVNDTAPAGKATGDNKPIWPWFILIPSILLLVSTGPGVIMLPIMPLFLAGMSTDSGQAPAYVPMLIIMIGYGLLAGFSILLYKAVRALVRGKQ